MSQVNHLREELHLHLAAVDDVDDVVDGDGRLGNVGGEDDLGDALGGVVEGGALVLPRQLGVEGDDAVCRRAEDGMALQMLQTGKDLGPAGEEDEDGAGNVEGVDVLEQGVQQVEGDLPLTHVGHSLSHG